MSIEHAGSAGGGAAAAPGDETLMLRVRSGDTGLLAEIFERHNRQVYGFFYRMTGSRELSEDLVQDVFLRILRYRETYQPKTSFSAWMYGIARNAMIDQMRKRRPEASFDESFPDLPTRDEPVDERMKARQETELLQQALASLPADKREVLILARYQDLRYEEIGRILGCEPNAVKQRVFRAVKALGDRFIQMSGRAS
ncbi:MAG: sigma-70 family RNA polymerase sigma factor [Bryobacteraceae bacterium]|nr:sigma-70 family RNA polymerase sigma factor [Bryobacteraceae bacterium]